MSQQEKLAALEEMMELDEETLAPEMELDDIEEWDSMAALSFVVLLKDEFDRDVAGPQIRAIKTVQDMLNMMEV